MSDNPLLTLDDPYAAPDWWTTLESVDGVAPATERDPELEPDEAGREYLAALLERLAERAQQPDVQAFLDVVTEGYGLVTTTAKPPCVRVLWRGVVVCSHSVPKLNAWAKSVGDGIYLKPLPGCGSYQTSTAASAGTHAGGGAIDIDLRAVASGSRKWVADKGRTAGLQVSWHRNAISGLWTWHAHALDPDCPQLAKVAAAQCVECFNGGDGLVGTTPDGNTRVNIPALKTLFSNRAVVTVADTVYNVGSAVVFDAKVRGVQRALRLTVDGKLGPQTYWAVWRLSKASRDGRAGFLAMPLADRKLLQRNIGCRFVDGGWIATGSEMPQRLRDAVGGVQRAMGLDIDRVWTDNDEGKAFGALVARAGFKP